MNTSRYGNTLNPFPAAPRAQDPVVGGYSLRAPGVRRIDVPEGCDYDSPPQMDPAEDLPCDRERPARRCRTTARRVPPLALLEQCSPSAAHWHRGVAR